MNKINPKLFTDDVEQKPIRDGLGQGLVLSAEKDERVVGLCADLTESTRMDAFAKKFPNRFVQVGVAEQNLATVASGMASMGKIPFMNSYAMFSPGRNWEQIRTTICYNNQNVKIVGSHAGVSVGPDGGSHQALEDIAITRVIPKLIVVVPCDSIEAKKATIAIAQTENPTYIRLSREKSPIVTTEETPFEIGKAEIFFEPENNAKAEVGIVACGQSVYFALAAARLLAEENINVKVVNLSTIKPIDAKTISDLAKETGAIVTAEEHQITGGMGSAVAECLSKTNPVPMEYVGVADDFGQSGTPKELFKHYKLDETAIVEAVKKVLQRKK